MSTRLFHRARCEFFSLAVCLSLALCLLSASLAQGAETLSRFRATHKAMGVEFTLTLYAPDETTANAAFAAAWKRIDDLNRVMSDYDPESELMVLCRAAPHAMPMPVSDDLWQVLRSAERFSHASDGAFDVTVGPLTRLWRRSKRQKELPERGELQTALAAVGYQAIVFDTKQHAIRLTKPNMRLDLGGIGQGFAADEVLKLLKERGITRALIDASGDVVASDPPPHAEGWTVDVAGLDPKQPAKERVLLANGAISTSGDAFQFVEIAGVRYGHIVDPKTGLGLTRRCSVTVRAKDGTTADALATAICVLGPERGLKLAEAEMAVEALVIFVEKDEPVARKTSGWR